MTAPIPERRRGPRRSQVAIQEWTDGPPGPEEQEVLRTIVASNREYIGIGVTAGKRLMAWIDGLTAENEALRARLAELNNGAELMS